MNARISLVLVFACLCIGFDARADEPDRIEQIAQEAGVSTRQVRMVVGNRTPFAGYRINYDRIAQRVYAAMDRLGAEALAEQDKAKSDVFAVRETSAAVASPNTPR